MRVSVLELPARWMTVAEALADVDARLGTGPATELALLPEAALTGYVSPTGETDLAAAAEAIDGPTAAALAALAVRHRTHVVGPLIERSGDACFNSTVGFDPAGARVLHYRKRHPWAPETWATPGDRPHQAVEIGGVRVAIATCYDLHFVAAEAADVLAAADLLLFPSAWVERRSTRVAMLRALAARFDIAVANANWGPGVVRIAGQGGSCVIDRGGAVRVTAPPGGRADATIDMP